VSALYLTAAILDGTLIVSILALFAYLTLF
jgi:hypothetical protein